MSLNQIRVVTMIRLYILQDILLLTSGTSNICLMSLSPPLLGPRRRPASTGSTALGSRRGGPELPPIPLYIPPSQVLAVAVCLLVRHHIM